LLHAARTAPRHSRRLLSTTAVAAANANGLPGDRLPRLRALLDEHKGKRPVRILETHNGLTGLIAETQRAFNNKGVEVEFDGMWSSSLTASSAKGKPDIETVDTTERLKLVAETLDVTSKPMIYDGDTGGKPEIFAYTVRSLEQLGVSAAIIEDKTGLKQNSLFGTDRKQVLADIPDFCALIKAGQAAKRHPDFMVVSRLEALIAGLGEEEALKRAEAYIAAGTDAIMIHSKQKSPDEVLSFLEQYHKMMGSDAVPVIAVPTTYNVLTEDDLRDAGVDICIYANHLLRAAYPAMSNVAKSILENSRSLEADKHLLGVKPILTLVGESPRDFQASSEPLPTPDATATPTKVDPVAFYEHTKELGVEFFTGVPDSLLAPFCATVDKFGGVENHLIAANEGAAMCTAAGHYFASGKTPLVYLQNSGLGNTVNPITSMTHSEVYGCPMVVMIGWRGAPGVKDEPQHVVQGRLTRDMLECLEVDHFILPADDAGAQDTMAKAVAAAEAGNCPVAVLVPKGTFAGDKNIDVDVGSTMPNRMSAIQSVLSKAVGPKDAVVSTTGYCSREVFQVRADAGESHEQDFLTVGSMGHSLAIAQGVAMAQPDRTVWCLDGDGAALMHLGSLAISGSVKPKNLRHVLLNNEVHDSVGGQPTASKHLDFATAATALGYAQSHVCTTTEELESTLASLEGVDGPIFIEAKLSLGTSATLGRPTRTTAEAKDAFMTFLGSK